MTKLEKQKCEKLMYEAIRKAKQAKEEYEESEKYLKDQNSVKGKIEQRKADQHMGYAEGINQVLATLGFKHDDMKTLGELL